ncbi:MAG: hypothetical protein RIE73_10070 [Coleofasciculus sp. C1-SOL-03]|jgi:hypothetical protein|uniref:hypothetical protein n=1 Tax=Coleofasciculus sp. C1-SOL-03 TaxID=3069522 RepID=UPI0032F90D53
MADPAFSRNNRDEQLRQLITIVQQHPQQSLAWRLAMYRLLREIQQLPRLAKSNHPDYGEVFNDTLKHIAEQIRDFQPQSASITDSLTNWINLKLRLRYNVIDLHSSPQPPPLSLDAPLGKSHITLGEKIGDRTPSTLEELDAVLTDQINQQKRATVGMKLQHYINQDPEGRLRQCHPQAFPHCHCQLLSQRLLLKQPPDRIAEIAREFNIDYHALYWHWKRKGLPLLQKIAHNFGYSSETEPE